MSTKTSLADIVTRWIDTADNPPKHWWTHPGLFHWTNLAFYGPMFLACFAGILYTIAGGK